MPEAFPQAARARGPAARHAAALRTATRVAHERVDALFPDGVREVADYCVYLRGMHRFAGDLGAAFALAARQGGGARSARLANGCASATARLASDLVALHAAPLSPRSQPPVIQGAAERLGWEYVFAGSAHGARMLLRHAKALGYDGSRGARFLDAHAAGVGWDDLLERIERQGDADAGHALHRGARAAFAHAEACFLRARDEALHATGPEPNP